MASNRIPTLKTKSPPTVSGAVKLASKTPRPRALASLEWMIEVNASRIEPPPTTMRAIPAATLSLGIITHREVCSRIPT